MTPPQRPPANGANSTPSRWIGFLGVWLLLSVLFASQLYWAGYVKPWKKAFANESVYWLAWGIVSSMVFRLCRKLEAGERRWLRYLFGFLVGAVICSLLQSVLDEVIHFGLTWMVRLFSGDGSPPAPPFSTFPASAIKVAGVNLPVFGALVLAWHAVTYYHRMQDRQMRALELESLLHESELQVLRSQLNPHFLFNTLHSIAELVSDNPPLAEKLILRLGQLLRRALLTSNIETVSLAEEVELARGYLEIEQARLGEKLFVEWQLDPLALPARVPSFILQPVIENAVLHGIVPTRRSGTLTITARQVANELQLAVRDTGPGLPPESERREGTGLTNTRRRLQRLYGGQAAFEFAHENGLVVTIRLPFEAAHSPKDASLRNL